MKTFLSVWPRTIHRHSNLFCLFVLSASPCLLPAQTSVSTSEFVGVANTSNSNVIYTLSNGGTNDGSSTSTQFAQSFTGQDGSGVTQTMNYTGFANSSASYGQLHLGAGGSVSNTYYSANNPIYFDGNTGAINPNGSPNLLVTAAFGNFSDTLQYGGALQAGYKARYIFHVDGSNDGYGAGNYLRVSIGGNEQTFADFDPGQINQNYATMDYEIDGSTPQQLDVTFAAFFQVYTDKVSDGSDFTGEANYANTATLAGIEVVDANGDAVSGVTITSGSGTQYAMAPEPGALAMIVPAASLGLAGSWRRRRRQRVCRLGANSNKALKVLPYDDGVADGTKVLKLKLEPSAAVMILDAE